MEEKSNVPSTMEKKDSQILRETKERNEKEEFEKTTK